MNIWKRGVCLLLTLVMAAALAGCGTRREPQTLRVCLPELPGTLDPAMVHHRLRAHRGEPSV